MLRFNSLGMAVPISPLPPISNTDSRPVLSNVVDCTCCTFCPQIPTPLQVHPQMSTVKTATHKLAFVCSYQTVFFPFEGLQQISVDDGEASGAGECNQSEVSVDLSENNYLKNRSEVVGLSDSIESLSLKIHKERIRRTKIGLANKGRVAWNKGRKHTAETRERIKQRTLEALRNPKVRKKMSEHPRPHSDQIKAKISDSLRYVWQWRLKSKRLRDKFVLSWEQSIANAARKGGSGQEELDWDSYNKIKQQLELHQLLLAEEKEKEKQMAIAGAKKFSESWAKNIAKAAKKGGSGEQELDWDSYEKKQQEMILLYQLQRTAEMAKAKEIARVKAEKTAKIKAIKKVMLAQKRKDRQEGRKARGDRKSQRYRKANDGKGDLEVEQQFELNPKLTKIHIRKIFSGLVAREGDHFKSIFLTHKKLNLELIKREQTQKEVSLADQIQAARDKKGNTTDKGSSAY